MEDDLVLNDREFFAKILYLDRCSDGRYAFLPHRCEHIPGQGDVLLSGIQMEADQICSGIPARY